jgi:hypothetical protein
MKIRSSRDGFILLITIMMLAIGLIVVTQFFQRGQTHVHLDQVFVDREKAKMLARSGIQIAIAQLSILDSLQTGTPQAQQVTVSEKDILQTLIPSINRWQTFVLQEKIDGVDGAIKICVGCEDGKFNINKVFDFKQKKFFGEGTQSDMKKVTQEFFALLKPHTRDKNLFDAFEKFLKKSDFPLNDPTQLLSAQEFKESFRDNIFYQPPQEGIDKNKRPVFITDVFTTFSMAKGLQPWFFSDSMCALFSFKRAEFDDVKKRIKEVEAVLKEYKPNQPLAQLWEKQLLPLYSKDLKSIPKEISPLFQTKFEPSVFCVLSYGVSGSITQKLFAIVENRTKVNTKQKEFVVKKMYWL